MAKTYDWLSATLVREYKLEPQKITLDATLEDLGIDSLGMAELLFSVEDEFGIVLPRESVPLHSVGEVVDFIDALVAARQAPAGGHTVAAVKPAVPDA